MNRSKLCRCNAFSLRGIVSQTGFRNCQITTISQNCGDIAMDFFSSAEMGKQGFSAPYVSLVKLEMPNDSQRHTGS